MSQVDAQGWRKLIEGSVIAESIVDRMSNLSHKIPFKGGSYRERLGEDNGRKRLPESK